MARLRHPPMPVLRTLSAEKRKYRGQTISVAIDPTRTFQLAGSPVRIKELVQCTLNAYDASELDGAEDLPWAQSTPLQWTPRRRKTLAKSSNSSAAIVFLKPYTLSWR